jgi:hypothetical protein
MHEVLTWPVGREGDDPILSRIRPPLRPVVIYIAAAGAGGSAAGAMIAARGGAARYFPAPGVRAGAFVLIISAAVLELLHRVAPLPQPQRQVPRDWTLWPSRDKTAAAFGVVIGAGVFTYFQHATMYALGALLLFAPTVPAGLVVGAGYGLARGFPVLLTWFVNVFTGRRVSWYRLVGGRRYFASALAVLSIFAVWTWPLS